MQVYVLPYSVRYLVFLCTIFKLDTYLLKHLKSYKIHFKIHCIIILSASVIYWEHSIFLRRMRRDIDLALSVRLFVRPDVRPSGWPDVRPSVCHKLVGAIYQRLLQIWTSGVYRSHWVEVHCTRTITLHFLCFALCYFSCLNFVWNISRWLQKISAWNFIGR